MKCQIQCRRRVALALGQRLTRCGDAHRNGHGHTVITQSDVSDLLQNIKLIIDTLLQLLLREDEYIFVTLIFAKHTADLTGPVFKDDLDLIGRRAEADTHILRQLLQIIQHDIRDNGILLFQPIARQKQVRHLIKNDHVIFGIVASQALERQLMTFGAEAAVAQRYRLLLLQHRGSTALGGQNILDTDRAIIAELCAVERVRHTQHLTEGTVGHLDPSVLIHHHIGERNGVLEQIVDLGIE